ncbi:ribosome biogenesis GTPase Der [Anaerofustis stercorihominis]|uniref:GTPase Der n=3 Tax=Anaerofustis stercorihominis TaxID=214853 RepID=B1CB40_9FIRM|nr:ribosome biogenesis GTPase Der [Anaerofustis stercorihominis]EDS71487.1 ribosome biogenesis GTPase Der [Anaerofustis stercorihominis DSM 17244]MCQ4795579.1 ribosome biogenesis GTPase Der [Anaerofustis stercorihominis]RGD73320.1 ribosome biogenesis GTPase Der [Anaerofustis stercorihominis]
MREPFVALIGRPNTGKSTLFNKISGKRISIVEDTPGVTRDRIITDTSWSGNSFFLIDTGGIEPKSDDVILKQMKRQANLAIDMADVIVLVVDGRAGVTASDREVATMIRKSGKPCVLAVNKIDSFDIDYLRYEFYDLALGEPIGISAEHALGFGDLLDEVVKHFPENKKGVEEEERTKIAVVGKPNAGKSSLVNTLLGENRVIVSNISGTTRDAIDTIFNYEGKNYTLIDTAGIRRKAKIYDDIEHYSTIRAIGAIERADICLLMIDAMEGVTDQDVKIAGLIKDRYKAVIIVINKWDLVEKETNTMKDMEKKVRSSLYFLDFAPILFISATEKKRTHKLMPLIEEVLTEYGKRITTGLLNEIMGDAVMMNNPPSKGTRRMKIFYTSQVSTAPPTFVIFVNDPELEQDAYSRYLTNKLREAFTFLGSPIKLIYRKKQEN